MSGYDPRSLFDRLVGACLLALVGAAALFIAVRLIEAVATALLVVLLVAGLVTVAALLVRARMRGW